MTNLDRLDDADGPARPISQQQARALVRGALKRVIAGDEISARSAARSAARPTRRYGRAAIVLAGLLLGGAALAGLATNRLWWSGGRHAPTSALEVTPTALPATPATELGAEPAASVEPEAAAPSVDSTPPRAPAHHKALPAHPHAVAHAGLERAEGENKNIATGTHADDLLSLANQLRGQRRWHDAAGAYQLVISRFPDTDSAYVAMLARAELLLDHLGRPLEALTLFQRALAQPSGLLTEEAHYGIASCYRTLGDADKERQALNAFLDAHPHSLLRASAASRLAELR